MYFLTYLTLPRVFGRNSETGPHRGDGETEVFIVFSPGWNVEEGFPNHGEAPGGSGHGRRGEQSSRRLALRVCKALP